MVFGSRSAILFWRGVLLVYDEKTVAVVVPAYNEESQIRLVLDMMPDFVDRIVVVNDGSKDATAEVVAEYIERGCAGGVVIGRRTWDFDDSPYNYALKVLSEMREREEALYPRSEIYNDNATDRIVLVNQQNSGVGAAIATGYKWCRDRGIDCAAVMAGDGQMDPAELEDIIAPVIVDGVDYVKGNRLVHPSSSVIIPRVRFFGNSVLSLLTKIASGYWNVSDTQTGYTAISLNALERIPLHEIYRSYGCPNDILVKLNMAYCTIREVPIKPVYRVGEQSKMKIGRVIPRVSWLLFKSFFKRIFWKYLVRDFHPLSLFYFVGMTLGVWNLYYLGRIVANLFVRGTPVPQGVYMIFVLFSLFSYQSIGFAMWMDIHDNQRLCK